MSSVGKMIVHTIDVDPAAPSRARYLVSAALVGHPKLDDLLLATSELVTNVVRHGEGVAVAELILDRAGGVVRIGVRQRGDHFDRAEHLASDPHGRGLTIVEAVSDRWGVEADGDLEVWFEVDD
jgi:anti-sigma regulatory factor (Ser/Thr protein kinase)